MNSTPFIIDTDPGVDDALALLTAFSSKKLDIEACISTFGNSTTKNTTKNLILILKWLNQIKNTQIGVGKEKPLEGSLTLAESHGEKGLGGLKLKEPISSFKTTSYLDLYKTIISRKKIKIIALGPLTNIASLLTENPELQKNIESITIMGGVFNQAGNITKYAEFNAYNDPKAFDMVINLPIQKILIPANICRQLVLTKKELEDLKLDENVKQVIKAYINYYLNDKVHGGFTGGVMYDVLTILFELFPSNFTLLKTNVSIETKGLNRGQTTFTEKTPNCKVATKIDSKELKEKWLKLLNT